MLVSSNNRCINHHPLQIRFLQNLEDALPNAVFCPAVESGKHGVPLAVATIVTDLGQVPPRRPGAADPEHRVDKKAIVGRRLAGVFRLAGKKRFNASPLVITKGVASHGHWLSPSVQRKILATSRPRFCSECQHALAESGPTVGFPLFGRRSLNFTFSIQLILLSYISSFASSMLVWRGSVAFFKRLRECARTFPPYFKGYLFTGGISRV